MQQIEPQRRVALLQQAVAQRPQDAALHYELASVLAKLGQRDAALASFTSVLDLDASHYNALYALVRAYIAQDDLDRALAACDLSLSRAPGNTPALATKSIVLLERNERAAAQQLLSLDSLLQTSTPVVPEPYAEPSEFLAALKDSIHANPNLEFEPRHRTARGGSRADLEPTEDQPESLVRGLVMSAIQTYRERLSASLDHPFLAAAPRAAQLTMWTNVLQEGGYHTPHIHPGAWLSGVFYVSVPAGGAEQAGELELGCPADILRSGTEPLITRVCPRPGLLVLFPSYVYHRTLPTRSREERISIAFDLAPAH